MKKLIFALFPFALLFGKTEIRLQTIDYEPFVEEMVAEIELEDGEIVSQTLNGKEATEEDFEKLARETGEQIGFETEIVSFQQNAIAEYVRAFLKSKGIEYENHGTKLVVEKLDPEIIAEITAGFSFVESIEEVEEERTSNPYQKVADVRREYANISSPCNPSTNPIGVIQVEVDNGCPNRNAQDKYGNEMLSPQLTVKGSKTHQHATQVASILQEASCKTHVYCANKYYTNLTTHKDFTNSSGPYVYMANFSLSNPAYRDNNLREDYNEHDAELDNYIFENRISAFVGSGNKLSPYGEFKNKNLTVTSPGRALNAITVGHIISGTFNSNHTLTDMTIYNNPSNGADKPEFLSHGYFLDKNQTKIKGSSLSTPFVASSFGARYLSRIYSAKKNPHLLKAILLAIAENPETSHIFNGSPISEKYGAGELIESYYKSLYKGGYYNSNSLKKYVGKTLKKSFYAYNNKIYKIAISWLTHGKYTENNSQNRPYLNIDLYVKDEKGNVVAKSEHKVNNFEVIKFWPQESGTYSIEFKFTNIDYQSEYFKDKLFLGYVISKI